MSAKPEISKLFQSPALDPLDVAVHLETAGITDVIAREKYGRTDTWDLAQVSFPACHAIAPAQTAKEPEPSIWMEYALGLLFCVPLVLSCLATLALKFSLWGGRFPEHVAEAVGLGTISSFIVTGGFVQTMSRMGMFYAGMKEYRLTEACIRQWLLYGFWALTLSALAELLTSLYFNLLPGHLSTLALSFHLSLGAFWLAIGVLYMLDRTMIISGVAAFGIGVVGVLHLIVGLPLIPAQIAGILLSAVAALVISFRLLRGMGKSPYEHLLPQPVGRQWFFLWPYFVYGTFYYAFLFSDRLLAWTVQTNAHSLSFQFRGDYETGMDIALFSFILQVAWVRSANASFRVHLTSALERFRVGEDSELSGAMCAFHRRSARSFGLLVAASTPVVFLVAKSWHLLDDPRVVGITLWALTAFPLFVLGLWNLNILFALSLPSKAAQAMVAGTLGNIGCGYLLSRVGSYPECAAGLAIGSAILAVYSWHAVKTALQAVGHRQFAAGA